MRRHLNARQTLGLGLEILVNFALPWLAYRLSVPYWGEHGAVLASALPPLLWSGLELIWHRRLDLLSLLVLGGILLSLFAVLLGGSATLLLLRESLITGAVGVVFLLSALARRPLIYYLARASLARQGREAQARFDARCRDRDGTLTPWLRSLTQLWGGGLVGEMVLRLWLARRLSVDLFLLLAPWLSYGIYGLLAAGTWLYLRRVRNSSVGATAV